MFGALTNAIGGMLSLHRYRPWEDADWVEEHYLQHVDNVLSRGRDKQPIANIASAEG